MENGQERMVLVREEEGRKVLSVGRWEMSLWQDLGDGEPRVLDVDAARVLGFKEPRAIRKLIERIWSEDQRPDCRDTVSRQSTGNGGTREFTVNAYWLTEAELLKVCARSETEVAEAILDEMIAVYLTVRRHLLVPPPPPSHTATPKPARDAITRKQDAFRGYLKSRRDRGDIRPRDALLIEFNAGYTPRDGTRPASPPAPPREVLPVTASPFPSPTIAWSATERAQLAEAVRAEFGRDPEIEEPLRCAAVDPRTDPRYTAQWSQALFDKLGHATETTLDAFAELPTGSAYARTLGERLRRIAQLHQQLVDDVTRTTRSG